MCPLDRILTLACCRHRGKAPTCCCHTRTPCPCQVLLHDIASKLHMCPLDRRLKTYKPKPSELSHPDAPLHQACPCHPSLPP